MPSQLDLDQGGTFRQMQKVFFGPSVGWIWVPAAVILPVTVAGITQVQIGNSLITVNVNGAVTLQLPKFKGSVAGAGSVPGSFTVTPIVIVDIGGFATANPITILAGAGETIDGQASISLSSSYGAFTLQPDVINGGATLIQ
jgi:hypothetical protein